MPKKTSKAKGLGVKIYPETLVKLEAYLSSLPYPVTPPALVNKALAEWIDDKTKNQKLITANG